MDLTGASAVVIGGTGGFGSATVRRLVAAGATTVIADVRDDAGKALADELGEKAVYAHTDVTSDASVAETFRVAEDLGPVRAVVVVHGGGGAGGRLLGRDGTPVPTELFAQSIDIFLNATYRALSIAAASIARSEPLDSGQRGVVVTTASIAGLEGQVGQTAYGAAKAGVIGLTLPAARDLAPVGIRVVTIAPGTFFTPAFGMSEEEAYQRFGTAIQNPKRMGRADEYAALALHIVDNDYLNGETIRLDGALRFPASPKKG
ncbi:SDR family NAD(P)-dependent oxidoreductase [Nocardioides sp. YIM 152588]|uniref:SDR family NAD(P)-dependent oxidoreductase n=1 Tax=Nocardioides sp. YIM 152588 TaxID=3158259 RepID=UPI0032E3E28A